MTTSPSRRESSRSRGWPGPRLRCDMVCRWSPPGNASWQRLQRPDRRAALNPCPLLPAQDLPGHGVHIGGKSSHRNRKGMTAPQTGNLKLCFPTTEEFYFIIPSDLPIEALETSQSEHREVALLLDLAAPIPGRGEPAVDARSGVEEVVRPAPVKAMPEEVHED